MLLYVTVKSMGKRRPVLERRELVLEPAPGNLEELITAIVAKQVKELADKQGRGELIPFLTANAVNNQRVTGKIGFGTAYNDKPPELEKAAEAALLAFEDGLYKVFLREEACERLQEPLLLNEGDELVFIRFTMLAGSLW
ncbi:hypothetical protein C2I18_16105 [Paenibacillus sp. PK3_47]|uniref:hypothetical protein n=1 Tax=Paenibacillus sp. PK3_47 TaxID=2072642 RepID=UPI00201DCDEA|nr:hypothetical protein [Paenibacillus sp. PK3_47]UQZ34908.1 hypothetical protein C2I18_16105 [Paenibacillus sp. PK3_47]